MKTAYTVDEVRNCLQVARSEGKKTGLVPTMGYLHEGHLSLVRISGQYCDYRVMSIFVNRIQFNDKKDFDSYPVDLERDLQLAEQCGVDLVFVPDEKEMYQNNVTTVDVDLLTRNLCGAHRPGHFRGVFTVVTKLFNIVQPDVSVFGQKDIQQALSINKMVTDLNFPIDIIIAPIVREKDGLAMSSRNKHLNNENRKKAPALYNGLQKAEQLLTEGERDPEVIINGIRAIVDLSNADRIDYISVVNYDDLAPCDIVAGRIVVALAVYYGNTRLIDNMIVTIEDGKAQCVY